MKKEPDYFFLPRRKLLQLWLTIKFFLFLSLFVGLNCHATPSIAQQTEIQLNLKNTQLTKVLKLIQQQSGYNILYSNELLKDAAPVSVSIQSRNIKEVLNECLKGSHFDYEIQNGTIIIKARVATPQSPQSRKIKGIVVDRKNGSPMPGVTVAIVAGEKTVAGTSTSEKGNFELNIPGNVRSLTFSFVGYKTITEKIPENDQKFTVYMQEEVNAMDEVVVTGYFTKSKNSYTGAVKTIKADELKAVSNTNILTAIAALTPGLNIIERSEMGSNPNYVPELLLRGMSSFSNGSIQVNQPTIILDGVEISMESLYDLDMNDIDNITVLKDASATALYGSRAANGVIVVERKKLTEGKMRVAYNFTGNVQFPYLKDYDVLNAREKLEYERLAGLYTAQKDDNSTTESISKEQYRLDRLYNKYYQEVARGVNTDWLTQPARVGFSHDHSLRLYGGASNIRYELYGRFNNTQGVMKEDYRRRYALGFKLEYHIQDQLTLNNRTDYTETTTQSSPYGSFSDWANQNPYDRMYDEYGQPIRILSWDNINPMYEASLGNRNNSGTKNITNNTDIRWDINKLFRVTANFNISVTDGDGEQYTSPESGVYKDQEDIQKKGSLVVSNSKGVSWSGNLTAAFNKMSDNNSLISLIAGMEARKSKSEGSMLTTIGFYDDALDYVGQAVGYPTDTPPSGNQDISTELGFFANANYMFRNRYYADFVYRLSGSSKFGANQRYGQFWSGGLGWNLHNESFFQSEKIDLLKLRGSMGYTGKVNFSPYQAMTIYKYSNDLEYKNGIGTIPQTIGNDDLKWEREFSYNIGADISLWSRRLNATLDFYLKRTKDLVLNANRAPSTGVSEAMFNIGEMENKGFEFSIDGFLIQQNDFWWQLGMNGSTNKNRILKISNALKRQNEENNNTTALKSLTPLPQYEEGKSMTTLKVVRSAGIDPATGKEIYIKLNGEHTFDYSTDDKVVVGDTEPKFRGTVYTNVFYKGFSIYILGNFQCGGYVYNSTRASKIEGNTGKTNVDRRAFENRWKNPGDISLYRDIADHNAPEQTDRFVEKENIFNIGSVNLTYEFSPHICQKMRMRNLRIGVNLTDILRLSNVKIERGTSYLYSNGFEFTLSTTF